MKTMTRNAVAAAGMLLALAGTASAQVADYREIKTPALRTFTMPQPKRIQLDNGMVVFLQEDRELPLIRGSALIRGGARDLPAEKAGMMAIYTQSWRTGGTETKTGDELDQFLESRAARVETSGGEDSARVTLDVLKQDFDTVFPIFLDVLQKPAFRQDKIDLAKTQARTGISRRNDDPGTILQREASKLGYGADSPYARVAEYSTINAITRDDLLAFHKRTVHPNNIIVGLVGDFDSAAMEKKLRAAFASWKPGPAAPPAPPVGPSAAPGVYFAPKDDVTQSSIAVLHSGGPLRRDPDYYAIEVMNMILSGGFSGRLMNNIRSKAGLAYGVGGGLGSGWDRPQLFNVFMGTKSPTTVEAIKLLRQEVSDLKTKPFTAQELQHAKDAILNAFVFTTDSKAKVLNNRVQLEFYGYPADYWQKYQAGIQAVTADDVARVASKYVHPDKLAVVVVGNQKEMGTPLSSAGNVTTLDITIPEPGAAPKPAAGAPAAAAAPAASSPEALALLRKVQDFFGGKSKVSAVQATQTVAVAQMKGPQGEMEVELNSTIRYPDAQRRVMKTPMGEMTTVASPDAAFIISPMGSQDLPASQRDAMRGEMKLDMLSILKNGEQAPYVVTIAGTEKAGDVSAQVLNVAVDGMTARWVVDPATGKLLKTVRQGRMGEQTTEIGEWKTFGGINYPTSTVIMVGGEKQGSAQIKSMEINPTIDPKAFQKP